MKKRFHSTIQISFKGGRNASLRLLLSTFLSSSVIFSAVAQDAEAEDAAVGNAALSSAVDSNAAAETSLDRQLRVLPIGAIDAGSTIEESDPYAPEGLRLGTFIFRPSLEIGLSATRSVSKTETGTPPIISDEKTESIANQNAFRLLINSDWSRHALEAEVSGDIPVRLSGETTNPNFGATANLTLDLSSTTSLALGGELNLTSEDAQSAAFQTAVDAGTGVTGTNDPSTRLYAGTANLAHDFGGVTAQIGATIGRLEYGVANLSDGTSVSQSDLNSTDYNFTLRGGYALSGVLSPFVEASYGMRVMDQALDSGGVDRNATRYGLRVGTEIDMGEKLSGEASIGFAREKLADPNYDAINAITLAASLNWSPMRNTDVTLLASTEILPSGLEDIAGSTVYATELGLAHRLRSNLTANARLTGEYENFAGPRDNIWTAGAELGLTYNINRFLALTGRVNHERSFSSDETLRGSTTGAFVGLRLQR